jgi:hypothetical protein
MVLVLDNRLRRTLNIIRRIRRDPIHREFMLAF